MVLACAPLSGCLEVESITVEIDRVAGTATVLYEHVRGTDQDWDGFLRGYIFGDQISKDFPGVTVKSKALVADGEDLNLVASLSFGDLSQVHVSGWSEAQPYRYCPDDNQLIVSSNARYRDADGCVIWDRRSKKLSVQLRASPAAVEASLLPQFEAWKAAGSPAPAADPPAEPSAKTGPDAAASPVAPSVEGSAGSEGFIPFQF